ncbi:hypothetical protein D3C77_372820 [compost metagenome]
MLAIAHFLTGLRRGAAQTRCRCRVGDASAVHEGAARLVVGVGRRLAEVEHRGKAGFATFQQLAPLIAAAAAKQRFQLCPLRWPQAAVPLRLEQRVIDLAAFQQALVELRFDGADGNEAAIGAGVTAVERRRAIEQVLPALTPLAVLLELVVHGAEQGHTVADGGIDHLALAGALRFEQSRHHTESQKHRAAAHVTHQVQRWRRRLVGVPHGVQRAGNGQVIEVVTGTLR